MLAADQAAYGLWVTTAGYAGQWEGPGVAGQLLAIKDAIRRHGKHCGLLATSHQNLIERREQGFRLLGLGLDGGLLLSTLLAGMRATGRETQVRVMSD